MLFSLPSLLGLNSGRDSEEANLNILLKLLQCLISRGEAFVYSVTEGQTFTTTTVAAADATYSIIALMNVIGFYNQDRYSHPF